MVHRHRPLSQSIERKCAEIRGVFFQRWIPKRQRIKISFDTLAQFIGRLAARRFALRGQAKALQGIGIQSQLHRIVFLAPAFVLGEIQILAIPVAHVMHGLGHVVLKHAIVLLVHLPLLGIGFAFEVALALFAAPAHQEANTGCGLKVDDEVGITLELAFTLGCGERGEFQARGDFDQHLLKRPAFAFGFDHRDAHRIHRAIVFRDRAIQHAHHVVTLKIGGVRQHQIGKGHGLALEGIAHHEEGDHVLALVILAVEHLAHRHRVHRAVPGHVGHEDHQRVDAVGIALHGVRDHVVHQAMCSQRVFP